MKSGLDLLLALLYSKGKTGRHREPIKDRTRLVKLLFLLVEEGGFEQFRKDFDFEAYDFGPWSGVIFDSVESLRQLEMITVRSEAPESPEDLPIEREAAHELDENVESNEVNVYELTEKGLAIAKRIYDELPSEQKERIEKMKEKYNSMPLHDLLVHIYTNYPQSITKSKIRRKILKNSMFGAIPDLPEFQREREDFRELP
jgi:hypothetical protein